MVGAAGVQKHADCDDESVAGDDAHESDYSSLERRERRRTRYNPKNTHATTVRMTPVMTHSFYLTSC